MIEKQTIIDQIEVTRNKTIQVRLGLLLLEDGKEISCQWHRTVIEPGVAVEDQINIVNTHLQQMGKSPVAVEQLAELSKVTAIIHTPTVIAEHKQRQEEARIQELRRTIPELPLN